MKGRGGLCATIPPGTSMMPWWSAGCWGTRQCWQLMSSTERAVVLCGCPAWAALGVRAASVNVHTLDGERHLAATLRMLESLVAVSVTCLHRISTILSLFSAMQAQMTSKLT